MGTASGGIGISQLLNDHNAGISALETKMGIGASTPVANRLLFGNGTGTSAWTQLTSANLLASITNPTGTGSAVFGTSPAISSPTITGTGSITASTINASTVSSLQDTSTPLSTYRNESQTAFVASGGVWTGDSYAVNKNASMTAIVCHINGRRISIGAVTARVFTASKDTYIDILDNADGTGTIVYTEVTNNAASPSLASNSVRLAKIVTGASSIAAASSVVQTGVDSLNNDIAITNSINAWSWKTYTPVWTTTGTAPAIGNGSLTGRYRQIGKTVTMEFEWIAGSTTTYGTGNYTFSLPVTARTPGTAQQFIGSCYGIRQTVAEVQLLVSIAAATPTKFTLYYNSTVILSQNVTNNAPYTWANTDQMGFTATYEAA